ncbi:signal recognition particle protein [Engelhardtia mirabilis]|uniref:Signal recognition particle protein n=1 Tax=Engelhardtia mirabilis TaxID=2528011 RepID=A0A518BLV4_9BACT|nr:Signal recognition particle protein [Planctomycetes bacterium Pla133]QDV02286.1 Signal recognition particle protein [Planctomycetes bacterium Pla86]
MFQSLTQRLSGAFDRFRGEKELTESNIEEGLRDVRRALLDADVHFQVAKDFVDSVRERALGQAKIADKGVSASDQFVAAVHHELVELMGPEDARLQMAKSGPTVILMAGLQGAGKTTTCAKLARLLVTKHAKRPLLVAADVKRPAAVEQLRVLGRKLNVPVFHQEGLGPADVCERGVAHARAQGNDVVILDTAGRLHVDDELMDEVAEIARRTSPDDQILVVDSMTGQDAVRSAQEFHSRLSLTGVILTKFDGDARGGAALSLKKVTGCPILFLGTGEKIEDLDAFSAERVAGRILGMGDVVGLVEAAQDKIDETEAQAQYERLVMGSFTLEDMLAQLRMIQNLGPLKKVMGMLPGVGQQLDNLDIDDKHIKRIEALCTSMTARERLQPDLIDMGRRRRIARGAGQDVGAVNQLLKQWKQMKQLMKVMKKMGMGAGMGSKAKRAALEGFSPSGELAADLGGGGMLDKLGGAARGLGGAAKGLGSMMGLGGGGGLPEGFDPSMLAGGGVPGARGKSATRKATSARDKDKQKAKNKQKRKNRRK